MPADEHDDGGASPPPPPPLPPLIPPHVSGTLHDPMHVCMYHSHLIAP